MNSHSFIWAVPLLLLAQGPKSSELLVLELNQPLEAKFSIEESWTVGPNIMNEQHTWRLQSKILKGGDYWLRVEAPLILPAGVRWHQGAAKGDGPSGVANYSPWGNCRMGVPLPGLTAGQDLHIEVYIYAVVADVIAKRIEPSERFWGLPNGSLPWTITLLPGEPKWGTDAVQALRETVARSRRWRPKVPVVLSYQLKELAKRLLGTRGTYELATPSALLDGAPFHDGPATKEAKALLEEALDLLENAKPNHFVSHHELYALLGEATAALGQTKHALDYFERGLKVATRAGEGNSSFAKEHGYTLDPLVGFRWRALSLIEGSGRPKKSVLLNRLEEIDSFARDLKIVNVHVRELSRVGLAWLRFGERDRAESIADQLGSKARLASTLLKQTSGDLTVESLLLYARLLNELRREDILPQVLQSLAVSITRSRKTLAASLFARELETIEGTGSLAAVYLAMEEVFLSADVDSRNASWETAHGRTNLSAGRYVARFGAYGAADRFLRSGIARIDRSNGWSHPGAKANAHLWLSRVTLATGNYSEAREHADLALTLLDENDRASLGLARTISMIVSTIEGDASVPSELARAVSDASLEANALLLDVAGSLIAAGLPDQALGFVGSTDPNPGNLSSKHGWRVELLRAAAHASKGAFDRASEGIDDLIPRLEAVGGSAADDHLAEAQYLRGVLHARAARWVEAHASFSVALRYALREPTAVLAIERGDAFQRRARRLRGYVSALLSVLILAERPLEADDHTLLTAAKGAGDFLRSASRAALHHGLPSASREQLGRLYQIHNGLAEGNPDQLAEEASRIEADLVAVSLGDSPWLEPVDLGRALPKSSNLLDFYDFDLAPWSKLRWVPFTDPGPPSDSRLAVCLVRGRDRSRTVVDLGPASWFEDVLAEYLSAALGVDVAGRGSGVASAGREAESVATQLRERLWQPIKAFLGSSKDLVVCPDGLMAGFPLGVLSITKGKYLLEDHAITYLDGIWQLESAGDKFSKKAPSTLLLGGVDFTGRRPPGTSQGTPELAALPGSLEEVGDIAALLEARFRRAPLTLLTDAEATEDRLLTAIQGSAVVHLATHGYLMSGPADQLAPPGIDPTAYKEMLGVFRGPEATAGLVLALPRGAELFGDGLLDGAEVARLDGRGWELVVLSACHAARGHRVNGEGLGSLRRAFHLAGAKRVISPCWAVGDTDTRRMMRLFYEKLWKGRQPPQKALRAAQLAVLREKREQGHRDGAPGSWGAWLFSGGWR